MNKLRQVDGVDFSIVTPMHNESACIQEFHRRVTSALRPLGRTYEIVAVSDGSTDGTNAQLRALAASDHAVRAVLLSRNVGQSAAITAGFQVSRGRYVLVMDADLQHAPEDIPALVAAADKGFDLVSGTRTGRSESLLSRRMPSLVANWLLRGITGCPVRDMGGFKCLRGDLARQLCLRAGQHRLLPALVYLRGGSTAEVPIQAPPRFAGESHYNFTRSIDVLFDVLMLWLMTAGRSRPLYTFGRLGLWAAGLAAVVLLYLTGDKILTGEPIANRPPFYMALAMGGIALILVLFGFVLEMLSETLDRVSGRCAYVINTVVEQDGGAGDDV